jgi:hypothetical protein
MIETQARPGFRIAAFLKFSAICAFFLACFHWLGADRNFGPQQWTVGFSLIVAAVAGAWSVMRPRREYLRLRCAICGRDYSPVPLRRAERSGGLCPACRVAGLPPEQRRQQATLGFVIIAVALLGASFALSWVGSSLALFPVVFLALLALVITVFVLRVFARWWRLSRGEYALQVARACARETEKVVSLGPISVHIFGGEDITPMFRDALETCRARFQALAGEPLPDDCPLRVLAFGRRDAFEGFFRRSALVIGQHDGVYIPWSTRTIVLTTDDPPHRLIARDRTLRTLLAYYLLHSFRKWPGRFWLQVGIGNVIACGGDSAERARLNRRMLAALSRWGTALGTSQIFGEHPRARIRLTRDWQDFQNHVTYTQLSDQSWSVAEFLCGAVAPADRKTQFRNFVREFRAGEQERLFGHHFGFGFDELLARWRSWVLAQGIGEFGPTPPRVQAVLRERVLLLIADRQARRIERIQAIRELGRMGFLLGADRLIELLRTAGADLVPEIVWALQAISGQSYPAEPDRWSAWWESLPTHAVASAETTPVTF